MALNKILQVLSVTRHLGNIFPISDFTDFSNLEIRFDKKDYILQIFQIQKLDLTKRTIFYRFFKFRN